VTADLPEALPKFSARLPIKRPHKLARMIFVDVPPEALPKFSARLPIKHPHKLTRAIFVTADLPEALPKFSARLPIKRPHKLARMIFVDVPPEALPKFSARLPIKLTRVIFVTAESAEAEVSQAVEGLDAAEDGVNATPVAAASGLAVTEITTN
jgi:hypothetical protein